MAQDQRYHNARAKTPNIAAIERDAALNRAVDPLFLDQKEFYRQLKENPLLRSFVRGIIEKLITAEMAQKEQS